MDKKMKILSNLTSLLLIMALASLASGAIIGTYVTISGTSDINQAVVLEGGDKEETFSFDAKDIPAGTVVSDSFTLVSRAKDLNTKINLVTDCAKNITAKYYNQNGKQIGSSNNPPNVITMPPNSTKTIDVKITYNPYLEPHKYTVTTDVEPYLQ